MTDDPMYHEGMRRLQDGRETRKLADRLEQVVVRSAFTAEDRDFIGRCAMFFIATADPQGQPDCSYKGGLPGFVRVIDDRTLALPDYDGNGMYRTWGNVLVNPQVGLLFVDFETPKRLRVNGTARIEQGDPLFAEFPGCVFVVRITAEASSPTARAIFTGCKWLNIPCTRRDPNTPRRYRRGKPSRSSAMRCQPGTVRTKSRSELLLESREFIPRRETYNSIKPKRFASRP